jgi:uncharacterized protein
MPGILLDTGPLVAYLHPRDNQHHWAVEQFEILDPPFFTCEPVIVEACFLLARNGLSPTRVLETVESGVVRVDFELTGEARNLREAMARYANVPMSLADACLLRMAEMTGLPVCTLDTDFTIYRAHGRQALNLISPAGRHGQHEP